MESRQTHYSKNMDKLFKRFRKPPKAILLFADDMTKAGKK